MACSNANGSHKLPLHFIGKAETFKTCNYFGSCLQVSKKEGWIDGAIFTDRFNCHFVTSMKTYLVQRSLTLLLLDSAPAHLYCHVLAMTKSSA